jgi:DNA-binding NtrC family response regulator
VHAPIKYTMSTTPRRILIVDDETAILEVLRQHFERTYAVETTINGADALIAVRRERPDIVFLDITMPRMSGIEVLKQIKEFDPTIAVIMLTGNEHVALASEAVKSGAVSYVPKPFDLRYLDHLVAEILANRSRQGQPGKGV